MSPELASRPSDTHHPALRWLRVTVPSALRYVILAFYAFVAVAPIALIALNSLKDRSAIFNAPLALPTSETFSLDGYRTVLAGGYPRWLANSVIVSTSTVLIVLFFGSLAAFAVARYVFPGRRAASLYLVGGLLLPYILGSVVTLRLMVSLGLVNNLLSVILVTGAQSLPLGVFILTQFFREVPSEILEAGRVDGVNEWQLYRLTVPLIRPGLGAVAVLTLIPAWNDLWWPLILAPSRSTQTVILGTQQYSGQFLTDWNALLSSLTIAMLPVLLLFALFSKQLIRGLTAGAVK